MCKTLLQQIHLIHLQQIFSVIIFLDRRRNWLWFDQDIYALEFWQMCFLTVMTVSAWPILLRDNKVIFTVGRKLSEIGSDTIPEHSGKPSVVCLPVEFTVISSSCLVLQPTPRSFSCLLLLSVLEKIILASLFVCLFVFLFFVQPTMSLVYTKFGEARLVSVVLPGFAWLFLYYYCLAYLFLVLKHSSVSIYNAALHGPASLLYTRDGRTDGRTDAWW